MKVRNLLILLCLLPLLSSCKESTHDIPPTKGARFTKEIYRIPNAGDDAKGGKSPVDFPYSSFERYTFEQGDNPTTPSYLDLKDNTATIKMGKASPNAINVEEPEDKTKYILLALSALFIAGGIFLCTIQWPTIGKRLIIAGSIGTVLSITVADYGAYYAGAALIAGLVLVWEQYHAYQIGLKQPVPTNAAQ